MRTIQRAVKGPADKDMQIGVFMTVKADCQSGWGPDALLMRR